jgi:uncharacterized OB-fold protein
VTSSYLNPGLPIPGPMNDSLDAPYWTGLTEELIHIQRCRSCNGWQWGPEWICHHCLSFDMGWEAVEPRGHIYSWMRNWHPAHPALVGQGPYLVVLIELPQAGNVRMIGNLLGDPMQEVPIGAAVDAVFEHHRDQDAPYTLVQWRIAAAG